VLKDLPSNTHLDTRILHQGAPLTRALRCSTPCRDRRSRNLGIHSPTSACPPAASIDELARALPDLVDRHMQFPGVDKTSTAMQLTLIPIAAIHLYGPGSATADYALASHWCPDGVACEPQFREFDHGAGHTTRHRGRHPQGRRVPAGPISSFSFIGESMIYVALSMVLALALVEVLMPHFNAFLGRTIAFDYWRSPDLAISIAGAVLLVGTLAGAYPAVVLSASHRLGCSESFRRSDRFAKGCGRLSSSCSSRS